ncbi:alpha/beta fold hydrolase [Jannaschia formosa]|uniref:alpha/beta fold hydrolase n=1 Tax=Jannaschia formosa TaxID=2259592 RepID=UPI000E1BB0B0|nr:alpha/beta hydrolase [Jannaschia formosa]TFL18624.1 alpha/beta hydrolase [Jannaschia formosa]
MTKRALITGGAAALLTGGVRAAAARRERLAETTFPPQGELLDVGGVPVHVVVRGTGPDLVMIHGASGNLREFTFDLIPRLSERYRCIAFDRPGLGYTGRTDPAYASAWTSRAESPAEQAALLARAYRQVGEGAPLILGHSFGGTVALAWALDHPARALVLLAAPAMEWKGGLGPVYAVTASAPGGAMAVPLLTAAVPDTRLSDITRVIFAPDPVPPGYEAHIGGLLTLRRASLRANARQVNGLKPHVVAMQKRYHTLDLPIEWVHGDRDTIVPPQVHGHPFKARMPRTNLTMLPGIGHMPHHADPGAVVAAIDRAAAHG